MRTSRLLLQQGFSLLELMVALVIGLIISFATLNMFNSTTSALNGQDVNGKIQEDGSFALQVMSRYIRNAGYVDWTGSPRLQQLMTSQIPNSSFRLSTASAQDVLTSAAATGVLGSDSVGITTIHGCPGAYVQPTQLSSKVCVAATTPASVLHSITLATQVRQSEDTTGVSNLPSSFLSVPTAASTIYSDASDCSGGDTYSSTASPKGAVAVNRFSLDLATRTIQCTGNSNPNVSTPLAQNIEQLVFKYGQAQPMAPASAAADSYSGDSTLGAFSVADTTTVWPLVTTVEICVLVVGGLNSLSPGTASYTDCSGTVVTYTDSRLRRAMKATVSLRNRIRSTQ